VLCFFNFVFAQTKKTIQFRISPYANGKAFYLGTKINLAATEDSIKIDQLKLYLSNIVFMKADKPVWKAPEQAYLWDFSDVSTNLSFQVPSSLAWESIQFNIGIDSITSVSGVFEGDLDPTQGMYWAWQSGYINIKMQGEYYSREKGSKNFEFHLGGYQYPFNALQKINLAGNSRQFINIGINLDSFFSSINISTQSNIMSPGKDAILLSESFAKSFYILRE
jgi:hypothetical protein